VIYISKINGIPQDCVDQLIKNFSQIKRNDNNINNDCKASESIFNHSDDTKEILILIIYCN